MACSDVAASVDVRAGGSSVSLRAGSGARPVEDAIWAPAAGACKGFGALAYPALEPLTWGKYEWTAWSEDRRLCYSMLAEAGLAAASFGVSFAEPRSSPVFGAGSFDRFFRDALRSRSKTDNFFNGTIGSLYAPMFASAGALLVSAGVAGAEAYQDTVTRALPLLWLALGGNSLATGVVKKSFGRERPYLKFDNERGIDAFGRGDDSRQSFYSGHASTAFLAASFIDPVMADAVRSTEPRYSLASGASWSLRLLRLGQALALYGLATGVAYSRIEIDLHYMTDVLAGAAAGTLHGHLLYHWSYRRQDRRPTVSAAPHGRGLMLTWRF